MAIRHVVNFGYIYNRLRIARSMKQDVYTTFSTGSTAYCLLSAYSLCLFGSTVYCVTCQLALGWPMVYLARLLILYCLAIQWFSLVIGLLTFSSGSTVPCWPIVWPTSHAPQPTQPPQDASFVLSAWVSWPEAN